MCKCVMHVCKYICYQHIYICVKECIHMCLCMYVYVYTYTYCGTIVSRMIPRVMYKGVVIILRHMCKETCMYITCILLTYTYIHFRVYLYVSTYSSTYVNILLLGDYSEAKLSVCACIPFLKGGRSPLERCNFAVHILRVSPAF